MYCIAKFLPVQSYLKCLVLSNSLKPKDIHFIEFITKKNMEGNKQKTNINKIRHTADHNNLFLNKIQYKKTPILKSKYHLQTSKIQ